MAHTFDDGIKPVTFIAGADLTGKQYYAVTSGSVVDEVKLATGASNPAPIGILQDSGSTGQAVSVKTLGFTLAKVVACDTVADAGCDVDAGHYLPVDHTGQLAYSTLSAPNARSFNFLAEATCATINVFWLGIGGASGVSAS